MSNKGLVEGLPKLDQSLKSTAPLCTGCLLGKFDRRPFRPTSKKAESVCEKVHMDIKGPMDMMSIGKHLYFLILVDDYSGLTVAYPMKRKSDALKFYRGFSEQAWNQTGKRISYPRCDNAKEFLTSAFNENHSTQGTVLQDIPNYTPELNGTVERNIRTVMNMMRSMLKGAGLPKNLWAEAIMKPVISRIDLQVPASQIHINCGLELSLMWLDFESMVHCICACSQRKKKSSERSISRMNPPWI